MSLSPPPLPISESPVEVRKFHLKHEASVRSIGVLYYLASCFMVWVAVDGIAKREVAGHVTVAIVCAVFAVIYFQTGRWLRQLNPKAKVPTTLLSVIGLIGFPLGTLISVYILYLLHSEKGKTVFSEQYRQIVAETPEIRYRMSIIVWIFLAILLFFLGLIAFAVLTKR